MTRRLVSSEHGPCVGCGGSTPIVRDNEDGVLVDYWCDLCWQRLMVRAA